MHSHIKCLKKDKVIAKIINKYGSFEPHRITDDLFSDIVGCMVGQQLSTKAADTICKRFELLFPKKNITPEKLLKINDEKVRGVGVSYSKIKYMKGLAEMVVKKQINLQEISTLPDNEVLVELTKVKGIGPWTAEMILMFSLAREDVFSFGDLGLRNAISKLYKVDRDDLQKIEIISKKWSPYRSYAARYLWKSLDNEPKVKSKRN